MTPAPNDHSQPLPDPFREARYQSGVLKCPFHGEDITMILRHQDVRRAAKDCSTYDWTRTNSCISCP